MILLGYGVELEQLVNFEDAGFSVMEVPVTIKYKGLINTSKQSPIFHGFHVLSSIFRIAVERKPLLFFGMTGFVLSSFFYDSYILNDRLL